jgi:hypothetical protein
MSIQQADLGLRLRSQQRTNGDVEVRRLEHRVAVTGQFEFDRAGRQRLVFGAFTGDGYASGWNASGIGAQFSPAVYLKHFHLALALGDHLEVEYGSLYPIPGKSTAIIEYDNDGYLAGQRVRITRRTWLFDEITASRAHSPAGCSGPVRSPTRVRLRPRAESRRDCCGTFWRCEGDRR